jgi:hypothetical protein
MAMRAIALLPEKFEGDSVDLLRLVYKDERQRERSAA